MRNKAELKTLAKEMFDLEVAEDVIAMLDKQMDGLQLETAKEMFDPEVTEDVIAMQDKQIDGLQSSTLEVKPFGFVTMFLGNIFYNNLKHGKFIAPFNFKKLDGKDKYEFIQHDVSPYFSYVTSTNCTISPLTMPFDGGSTPLFSRIFKVFDPEYFIPAYLIHDWLFKCHQDGSQDFTFEQTAEILAEGIKTLMEVGYYDDDGKLIQLEQDEDALFLIYLAVLTPFARAIWDKKE